ncbi:uncharacterized protein LOC120123388 [Hibiscus syriacus]|uniref:uncharacterized protein LOC120123388 n=1 Tax=Hibiscus syriacus TaxID=106335 RepID=UPI001921C312|nr:uncharacterized protein LOC120123388 [Hibiscus syriacus]
MDQTENQKQKSLSQFLKSGFHRRLTHLFLSVSVFSLFFSYSYWLSLLHSFSFNFHDSLPFQLFSHAIDKNCIFLVCNGLLVFLAKYSGLICSSSMYNDDDDQSFKSYEDVPRADQSLDLEPKAPLLNDKAALGSTVDEAIKNSVEIVEEEDNKWGLEIPVEEDEEDIGESENNEEEEENGVLSTEELNKRFDEFIAKMKEELRIED